MYFKQFYLGCLAHASYLIGDAGEAAVIDPQRDVQQYIEEASRQGFRIKYVIETHLHADFVSGHRELAEQSGAEIVFGWRAGAEFPHVAVRDGDELRVGGWSLRILETPGHTPESISIVLLDPVTQEPMKIFTGDTLFIGDVGRPDLAASRGFTADQMASMLYDSLHNKLLTLPDAVEVFPAHGAGSLCGRNISRETMSTIGEQRKLNYALARMEKSEFVRMMTADLPPAPDYFPKDAEINRTGATPLSKLPRPAELTPAQVENMQREGAVILDVRSSPAFATGHVPGSLNLGQGGQFASWAGTLIPMGSAIVLVAEDMAQVDEAVTRLARVGLDVVKGYLGGGMWAWDREGRPAATIRQIPVDELRHVLEEPAAPQLVDVRQPAEYRSGHVPGAVNVPLRELQRLASTLDASKPTAVICQGGYRSIAAASILQRSGFRELFDVVGGTGAWVSAGFPAVS